ncbi:MAG: ABC transporter permease [Candidatus Delongbacteria bacterium]|nr:ABC transporter permease [Candidatus Delongbacteria bacterium]
MNVSKVTAIFRKELKDMLRDRRTMISMIVIPALAIPLLIFVIASFSMSKARQAEEAEKTIAIVGIPESSLLYEAIAATGMNIARNDTLASAPNLLVLDKKLDLAVEFPPGFEGSVQEFFANRLETPPEVVLYYNESRLISEMALRTVRAVLQENRTNRTGEYLESKGLRADLLYPFHLQSNNVMPPEQQAGSQLGRIIAYIVMILMLTGSAYPALDLTVGEKERQTLETLLVTPAGRTDIVIGKFLTILVISLMATLITIISLTVTMTQAGSLMKGAGDLLSFQIGPRVIISVLVFLIPVGMFFSALLMAVGIYARTMKEGQSYSQPLFMLMILPAAMSMLPGMELSLKTIFMPVVNASLVIRELFMQNWSILPTAAAVFGLNLLMAALLLWVVYRMFHRESVLFRS